VTLGVVGPWASSLGDNIIAIDRAQEQLPVIFMAAQARKWIDIIGLLIDQHVFVGHSSHTKERSSSSGRSLKLWGV
jgi:hypothetical protein